MLLLRIHPLKMVPTSGQFPREEVPAIAHTEDKFLYTHLEPEANPIMHCVLIPGCLLGVEAFVNGLIAHVFLQVMSMSSLPSSVCLMPLGMECIAIQMTSQVQGTTAQMSLSLVINVPGMISGGDSGTSSQTLSGMLHHLTTSKVPCSLSVKNWKHATMSMSISTM